MKLWHYLRKRTLLIVSEWVYIVRKKFIKHGFNNYSMQSPNDRSYHAAGGIKKIACFFKFQFILFDKCKSNRLYIFFSYTSNCYHLCWKKLFSGTIVTIQQVLATELDMMKHKGVQYFNVKGYCHVTNQGCAVYIVEWS